MFSQKDERELDLCKKAALATVNTWSFLRKKIVDIIDQSKVVNSYTVSVLFSNDEFLSKNCILISLSTLVNRLCRMGECVEVFGHI